MHSPRAHAQKRTALSRGKTHGSDFGGSFAFFDGWVSRFSSGVGRQRGAVPAPLGRPPSRGKMHGRVLPSALVAGVVLPNRGRGRDSLLKTM